MAKIEANGRTKQKRGKNKLPIDWEVVKKLCMMHCTIREICGFLEISEDTMEVACKENWGITPSEKFAPWYDKGRCSLRRVQWKLADTSTAMAIFLGKQYLGQSDNYNVNHKGETEFKIVNFGDKELKPWISNARDNKKQSRD